MADGHQALVRLLLTRSVERGDFVLASGARSSYYIDCRRTTMSAEGMVLIGRLGCAAIERAGWDADAVGGLTMGADPVAYAIAAASFEGDRPIDAFSVRKAAKGHGTKRRIEGNYQSGMGVVIVEDVVTSGASALEAAQAVEAEGGRVIGILAVVDRQQGGREAIVERGYLLVSLVTAAELGLSGSS
jgi:orotate phosphoribosyltransferase